MAMDVDRYDIYKDGHGSRQVWYIYNDDQPAVHPDSHMTAGIPAGYGCI